ncbi:hypothetical protein [Nostoc sp.]|uniref:hypothetical protein n=1 Tax=Nostoc sp. TaxID=1180 RepID=UPI002FFADF69
MGFAAIAVGISIDAACVRQAMPMAGYAYLLKSVRQNPKKLPPSQTICSQNQNGITVSKAGLNSRLVKQSASEFRSKVSRKDKGNLVYWEKVKLLAYFS